MEVTVEYLGHIKQILAIHEAEKIKLKGQASVRDLLSLLAQKCGEPFRKAVYEPKSVDLKPYYILSVNGLLLNQLKGLETRLKNGDYVILMPVVTGG